jgi:hypothetical protein
MRAARVHRDAVRSLPQFQHRSNAPGFSSPHAGHFTAGRTSRDVKNASMLAFARTASAGSSTHTWGREASMGSSPARLAAFALKMRARMPPWARRSTRRCASGRLAAE